MERTAHVVGWAAEWWAAIAGAAGGSAHLAAGRVGARSDVGGVINHCGRLERTANLLQPHEVPCRMDQLQHRLQLAADLSCCWWLQEGHPRVLQKVTLSQDCHPRSSLWVLGHVVACCGRHCAHQLHAASCCGSAGTCCCQPPVHCTGAKHGAGEKRICQPAKRNQSGTVISTLFTRGSSLPSYLLVMLQF